MPCSLCLVISLFKVASTQSSEGLSRVYKQTKAVICLPRKTCQISFLWVWMIVLLVLSSMLLNQQHALNKVSLTWNTSKTRLRIDGLMRLLWPEAGRTLISPYVPWEQVSSIYQFKCLWLLYRTGLPWITRSACVCVCMCLCFKALKSTGTYQLRGIWFTGSKLPKRVYVNSLGCFGGDSVRDD